MPDAQPITLTPPMKKALSLKNAGNKAFKESNYNAAIGAYSYSLETLEQAEKETGESKNESKLTSATTNNRLRSEILSNRSLCLGKIGEHQESLLDAKNAMSSDPTFSKGYLRYAQALYALKSYKKTLEALGELQTNKAVQEPEKIAKQVAQLVKRCNKMIAPKSKSKSKPQTTPTTPTPTANAAPPAADVHTFAQQLVSAALSCGVADPNKSKFEGAHLILSMVKDNSEKRLHVGNLFETYKSIPTLAGRARNLMNIVRKDIVGFAVLPHDFEIAKHLLRPRLFSRQKLDASGSTAMPSNDELPCWMLVEGTSTTSGQIKQANAVAVAVVVDYGKDGMLPVMTSTSAAWKVSFDEIRAHAMSNFRNTCQPTAAAAAAKNKKKKKPKKEWKGHMSGCLTSPWTDNTDGARVALFPELYVPTIPTMEGQTPRQPGVMPETVAIFGTNNCVLVSEASNPISQCFAGDIVINDMEKTVDHVSSVPHRLVRSKTTGAPWAWRPFYPTVGKMEFSVPSCQSEIDNVLDAVQGGGKKQIPIFGKTETKRETIQQNVAVLVQKANQTKGSVEIEVVETNTTTKKTKLKGGFLDGHGSNKSVLNDQRRAAQDKKKKQILMDSKSTNGLNNLSGKKFFGQEKKKKVVQVVKDELVEASAAFDGPREECVYRLGDQGVGYYKEKNIAIGTQIGPEGTKVPVVPKAKPATIDLATLNRSIGMYGGSSLFGNTNNGLLQKKSLFSL